jgi:ribonuclease PH
VAVHDAFEWAIGEGMLETNPLIDRVTAISAGLVDGVSLLDLDYVDDAAAEVDMNVVMTGRGLLVEVQGTAEGAPFTRSDLDQLLDLATRGINELGEMQQHLTSPRPTSE